MTEEKAHSPTHHSHSHQPESRIVMPGELLFDRPERISYAFIDGGKTYSTVVGLFSEGKLVPLEGPYEPLVDDLVVGLVTEVKFAGYSVDINTAYPAFLSSRETRERFEMGDTIFARITMIDEVRSIELGEARKLPAGRLVKVSSVKVPRIIGKKNSMLEMLSKQTGCEIYVGRNGYVWIAGKGNASLAEKAIRMIEVQAHTRGLTDRVAAFLKEEHGR
ncbi:MAG: exosome complex protein Rrp4 [Candidatus Micrarchaeota archaeon]|nr:exosome complex protein Rrp4 [Candidatus Micrarchaeota archaeon]